MISSTARDTVSALGWSTAVSGGWVKRTIGVLSKLINDRTRGISLPRERATTSVASAIWSVLTIIAVGGTRLSRNVRAASSAEAGLKSPPTHRPTAQHQAK